MLEGVVPDEINKRACDFLDGKLPLNPSVIPPGLTMDDLERIRGSHEPSCILLEDWYIEHVLLNPALAGALRSLLGPGVGLPILVSHHRSECPQPAQDWHHEADRIFGPELNFVEVFYFPQDTPAHDWIIEDDFEFHTAYYGGHHSANFYAHMFYWLCGKGDEFRVMGGQAWPWRTGQQLFPGYSYGLEQGYVPDWRRSGPDTYAYPQS